MEFIHYIIQENGDILSLLSNKVLKPQKVGTRRNYLRVSLRGEGDTHQVYIHRLVCIKYHPNPENKPTVNHIDGNTFNNCKDNLEWATYKEQETHAKRLKLKTYTHNKGKNHVKSKSIYKITKDGSKTLYTCIMDFAREIGVSNACTSGIIKVANKVKGYNTAYCFKWEWVTT